MKNKLKELWAKIKIYLPLIASIALVGSMVLGAWLVSRSTENEQVLSAKADEVTPSFSYSLINVFDAPEYSDFVDSFKPNNLVVHQRLLNFTFDIPAQSTIQWYPLSSTYSLLGGCAYTIQGFSSMPNCVSLTATVLNGDENIILEFEGDSSGVDFSFEVFTPKGVLGIHNAILSFINTSDEVTSVTISFPRILLGSFGSSLVPYVQPLQLLAQDYYNVGYSNGALAVGSSSYADGYYDGYVKGETDGYQVGYDEALKYFDIEVEQAYNQGYDNGYTEGEMAGNSYGYNAGYADGRQDGYSNGYADGSQDGYSNGYADGSQDGYSAGYDDAYDVAYETLRDEVENEVLQDKETFLDGLFSIMDAPMRIIRESFNFEIFGINISELVFFILTAVIVVFVVKKVKGG